MQSIRKSVLITRSAQTMFKLIDDVEHYTQFLPWCDKVTVHEHTETVTDATIHICYFGLRTAFRTRNKNSRPNRIVLHFVEGPFHTLAGQWDITALEADACKVTFALDYAFSSRTLEKLIGPVFSKITATFVDAFVKRANLIR